MSTTLELSDELRMLLSMRDTLYDGCWEDFVFDLRARLEGAPHVFTTIPVSEHMMATIRNHIDMITMLQEWENSNREVLKALN